MKIKTKSRDPKREEAEQKRLQALSQMKEGYKQQKCAIREALSNVDSQSKNKIIFNEDEENNQNEATVSIECNGQHSKEHNGKRKALFDEEDDIEEPVYNFELKHQFEGKKGQKLLTLQSKFKNDKRFLMNEQFLDDNEEQNESDQCKTTIEDDTVIEKDQSFDREHKKQFEILEQVLGKQILPSNEKEGEQKLKKVMLRFDPTLPEHEKFELKEDAKEKKKKKGKNSEKTAIETSIPEVSKETFYEVTEGLKDVLEEKKEFCLLSLFDKNIDKKSDDKSTEGIALSLPKNTVFGSENNINPFRYDSSTDDENEEIKGTNKTHGTSNDNTLKTDVTISKSMAPSRLWTESFFFKDDDYRLQEGLDFMKKMEIEEVPEFDQLRRNLKQIVKSKVKNIQRKNKPFKKKLGGRKKMIKIKKAMKR